MNYAQLFQDHWGGNLAPIVHKLCLGMDQKEHALDRIRVALDFDADWHPRAARQQAVNPGYSVKWEDKFLRTEGAPGNVHTLIGEMCAWHDIYEEKERDILEALTARAEPEKRGPGRPRKDAA